jgi:hypothetical protein
MEESVERCCTEFPNAEEFDVRTAQSKIFSCSQKRKSLDEKE